MSEPVSISRGIAARYAAAVFELAQEAKQLVQLEADVSALGVMLAQSADLRAMIKSPIVTRDEQGRVIAEIAKKMGLGAVVAHTLELLAARRRLFVLPQFLAILSDRLADARGEVTAVVETPVALSAAQEAQLIQTLKARTGKDVKLKATIDESLIGGLVLRLGSVMIDTSIRSKLAAMKNAMKEVG